MLVYVYGNKTIYIMDNSNKIKIKRGNKYILQPDQGETESELLFRQKMRSFVVKLNLLMKDDIESENPNIEFQEFLREMSRAFCIKYNIEIEPYEYKVKEPGMFGEVKIKKHLDDKVKERISETLKEIHEEKREIKGSVEQDFEKYQKNKDSFFEGLGKLR